MRRIGVIAALVFLLVPPALRAQFDEAKELFKNFNALAIWAGWSLPPEHDLTARKTNDLFSRYGIELIIGPFGKFDSTAAMLALQAQYLQAADSLRQHPGDQGLRDAVTGIKEKLDEEWGNIEASTWAVEVGFGLDHGSSYRPTRDSVDMAGSTLGYYIAAYVEMPSPFPWLAPYIGGSGGFYTLAQTAYTPGFGQYEMKASTFSFEMLCGIAVDVSACWLYAEFGYRNLFFDGIQYIPIGATTWPLPDSTPKTLNASGLSLNIGVQIAK